jgi:phage FluMu protein Com
MIICAECEKVLEKVPSWYSTVNIRFVCDACRKVNPQHWLPATLEEDEEDKPLERDEDTAFVEGEVSLEELEKRDRKRLVGDDDLFDSDLDDESEE